METPFSARAAALWGAFLACSWTWCIGMWLPVILRRDFGSWSFAVFAVPNVVGAALMGLMLRAPGASERFVVNHRLACHLFSFVTVAFQTFVLIWLLAGLGGSMAVRVGCLALFLIPAALVSGTRQGSGRTLAVSAVVLLASIGCAAYWIAHGGLTETLPVVAFDGPGLSGLGAVCVLGFMLCPYLDLTFHRARRQAAGGTGDAAFIVGFGVFFAMMIVFTFLYAPQTINAANMIHPAIAAWPVVFHILMQLGITDGLHAEALGQEEESSGSTAISRVGTAGAMIFALLVYIVPIPSYAGLSNNELVYRGFMAFYGLLFPAYVWTCVDTLGEAGRAPARGRIAVCVGAIVLASPFFWMGFIERKHVWLAIGVAIVAAARPVAKVAGGRGSVAAA
ncbi:MAG: hypothetical protein JSR77_02930 [Planctomycetes bacterium]|nr:hypothetical protein [Planctomycetota bacterium]